MRKKTQIMLTAAIAVFTAMAMLLAGYNGFSGSETVSASSHREAPLIALDPTADSTDVYAFVSPDRPNTVTVLANFIPFEEPAGGPNFFKFDDTVLYQIRLDNNGDGRLDIAIQFRFNTVVGNGDTFLYNTNTINNLDDPDWNVKQFYSVQALVRQGDVNNPSFVTIPLGSNLRTPPVNIGPRSTPNYETNLAEAAINTIGTGFGDIKVFAGQRDEGFNIDLGSIFDLLGLRPFNAAHLAPLPTSRGVDATAGYNVHTIAIQLPMQLLTASGTVPTGPNDPNAVIGFYSTASRPGTTVLNTNGTRTTTGDCSVGTAPSASCVQVSRLANPLVNELFVPIGTSSTVSENDKDLYNATLPGSDGSRLTFIRGTSARPVEPVALINLLYPPVIDAPTSGRDDLVNVFLRGVPGLNRNPNTTSDPTVFADLMRLNLAIPATTVGSPGFSRLGVIAGDLGGYPNGRRVGDDVVDVTFRVAAGVLLGNMCGNANGTGTQNCNQAPNNQLGDGVTQNDQPFRTTFPYLATPWSGYANPFHGRECSDTPDAPCPSPSPTPRP